MVIELKENVGPVLSLYAGVSSNSNKLCTQRNERNDQQPYCDSKMINVFVNESV